jgi:predicted RNA-binding protein (virulence factor B family)
MSSDSVDQPDANSMTDSAPAIGQFTVLRVVSLESVGAFLDWGRPKDLLLPFREQTRDLKVGEEIVVHIYEDNTGRPCSSMRIEKFLDKETAPYKDGEKVDLLIFGESDLGFKAVINQKHLGMLFKNELFQDIRYTDRLPGYIKRVRDDKKIDLILQPLGNFGSGDLGEQILEKLKESDGFLPITDKTDPNVIYNMFGVSKKKYKMALGGIYKKKLIVIEDGGIRLVAKA